MKYLSFVRSSEKYRDAQPPAAMMEAMGKLIEKFTKEGALVDTGGLAPSRDGFRMRLANGKLITTDGPFIESKEVIGGWAILRPTRRRRSFGSRTSSWSCTAGTGPSSRASARSGRSSFWRATHVARSSASIQPKGAERCESW